MMGMLAALDYDGPVAWTWDWWTQGVIPILVGIVSIGVTIAALVVAMAANNHAKAANSTAQAALNLSAEIADKEARERQADRGRALRERRNRVAEETLRRFEESMLRRPLPTSPDDAFARILEVVAAFRAACIREGFTRDEDKSIIAWLIQVTDEVSENIERESHGAEPLDTYSWAKRGWRVLQLTIQTQLFGWQRTGHFDQGVTASEVMYKSVLSEEFVQRLREIRREATKDPVDASDDERQG